ncbi:MAG: hypothetical protein Kow0063_43410 [Anaerolineae bacterium]
MKIKESLLSVLLVTVLGLAACGVATSGQEAPAAEAMQEKPSAAEEMADEAMQSGQEMAGEEMTGEAMQSDQEMTGEEMSGDKEMMDDTQAGEMQATDKSVSEEAQMMGDEMSGDEMMADDEAMTTPAWYAAQLTDVNSGSTFRVADFEGKVVLVETMAVWCSTCLRQQQQVQALHELLGERDDWVSLALDIDPNETPDILKAHADRYGFDWHYAVAPVEVAREIGQLYGDQFLNPPSAPMLIIDRQGQVHPLPFGVKSAQALQDALSAHLN